MSIISNASPNRDGTYPTGAFIRLWDRTPITEQYIGMCLFESERNMYDDSDFIMTVWNEEKGKPERHMFATTRFPCTVEFTSKPDAGEEVWAKYAAWKKKVEMEAHERILRENRNKRWEILRRVRRMEDNIMVLYGIPEGHLIRLRKNHGGFEALRENGGYMAILHLMASKRIRSNFKLNLRRQVLEWLKHPKPKYPKPLSPKQMDCL